MTVIGEAYIEVKGKTDGFADETERGVLGSVGGIAKKAAGVLAGGFAAMGAINFGRDILEQGELATKGLAQTENVIKSTGGAAGVSAEDITGLTQALEDHTAVNDDVIRSGANMLLTFTNVKNEVGDGNDIFNQATSILTDMSVAMGTDMKSQAIQLGKALNDPIAGVSALAEVGVTFTEQQKDQIKAMVEAGDTAGAQRVILAELNKEFGGSAAAQATAADRARLKWAEFKEELGQKLMPVVASVATFLADKLPAAAGAIGGVLSTVGNAISGIFNLIVNRDFTGGLHKAFGLEEDSPIVGTLFTIRDAFATAFGFIRDTVLPIAGQVGGFLRDNLVPVLGGLGAAILVAVVPGFIAWATAAGAAALATLAAAAPAIALGAAVALLVGGLIYAWQNFETFRTVVTTVIDVVAGVVQGFVGLVLGLWRTFGDEILAIASAVWSQIQLVVETAVTIVQNVINLVLAVIRGDWGAAWDAIKAILGAAWDYIRGTVENAMSIVGSVISAALGVITGLWDASFGKLVSIAADMLGRAKDAVSGGISDVVGFVAELPGRIVGALGDVGRMLYNAGVEIIRGLLRGIKAAVGEVYDFVSGIAGKIASLKGPLDRDRKLLVPAGRAIMEGLEQALASRQAALDARVRAITNQIAAAGASVPELAGVGATAGTAAAALPPALLAELRQLVAAVERMAQGAGRGGSWNVSGTDPVAVAAVLERRMDWTAGR